MATTTGRKPRKSTVKKEAPAQEPEVVEAEPAAEQETPAEPAAEQETPAEPAAEQETPAEPAPEAQAEDETKELEVPGAPLEAPNVKEAESVNGVVYMPAGETGAALLAANHNGVRIIDSNTGQTPDPDTMFSNPYGDVRQCEVRLAEEFIAAGGSVSRRLLMAAGTKCSHVVADQLIAAVKAQIAVESK